MCRLLRVSRSGYYAWLKRKSFKLKTETIVSEVRNVFESSKKTYGSPRICEELVSQGIVVSKSTVARVMRAQGFVARPRRKFVHTTDSNHQYKVFENLLNRDFESNRVHEKWVSDISYIPTQKGWAYLTTIIDLADRMIVSWTLSNDMSCERTSYKALQLALERRKIDQPLLFHSDRGVQYCSALFRNLIQTNKYITQSMSRKGNCWDNAVCESFFKTLKVEWTRKFVYKNIDQARKSIFDYIERWYNTKRKHSSIQYLSPHQKHLLLINQTAA